MVLGVPVRICAQVEKERVHADIGQQPLLITIADMERWDRDAETSAFRYPVDRRLDVLLFLLRRSIFLRAALDAQEISVAPSTGTRTTCGALKKLFLG